MRMHTRPHRLDVEAEARGKLGSRERTCSAKPKAVLVECVRVSVSVRRWQAASVRATEVPTTEGGGNESAT